jgi:hypothetical protein
MPGRKAEAGATPLSACYPVFSKRGSSIVQVFRTGKGVPKQMLNHAVSGSVLLFGQRFYFPKQFVGEADSYLSKVIVVVLVHTSIISGRTRKINIF